MSTYIKGVIDCTKDLTTRHENSFVAVRKCVRSDAGRRSKPLLILNSRRLIARQRDAVHHAA